MWYWFYYYYLNFRLQYQPLVVLLTASMDEDAKLNVRRNILKLGGHVIDHWSSDVTHLTMSSLKMTAKVSLQYTVGSINCVYL
jgi:hypothetical protein